MTDSTERAVRIGTHTSHCCEKHGCKYSYSTDGGKTCPVVLKTHAQEYPCEYCRSTDSLEEEIKELQAEMEWTKQLEAKLGQKVSGGYFD